MYRWHALAPLALLIFGGCDEGHPSLVADVAATPPRQLRRLSSREYNNVVRDLLGDASRPADAFVADVYPNGYDNGSALLAVQSDQATAYADAAHTLAVNAVASSLDRLLGGCDPSAQDCKTAFFDGFAARAFRRPLSDGERTRLGALIDDTAATSDAPTAIQSAVEVILQSPQFLYREELGATDAPASAGAMARLTDYEVASELSFLVTGSIPDDILWSAVRAGRFSTAADREWHARRLLETPAARDAMRAFLHQWLATDRLPTMTKDATVYPELDPALAASMKSELDALFDDVLWYGDGSLRDLVTRDVSSVDAELGAIYGVAAPADGVQRAAVRLDRRTRGGLFTRAGFLAAHSDSDSSGPIARGVFMLQSILCTPPPPRPANVPPAPTASDATAAGMTTRQRFAQHASDPYCARCHTAIDGVGFAFEEYDAIGRFRTVDNGQPVDASGEVAGLGPVANAVELSARLAGARQLSDCFSRQLYRWAMGQVEPDGDSLGWLADRFSTDDRITELVVSLIESPQFVQRTFEPVVP